MTETSIATTSDQIGSWLQRARELAAECGCPPAVEPAVRALKNFRAGATTLTVAGGPNAGTSVVINKLLDRPLLPVRLYTGPAVQIIIDAAAGPKEERVTACDGRRASLDQLSTIIEEAPNGGSIRLFVANPWLAGHNLRLVEGPAYDPADDEVEKFAEAQLEGADCVLLVVDALQALRRPEVGLLSFSVRRSVPAAVYLNRTEQLSAQERVEVLAYVSKHVEALSEGIPVLDGSAREGIERMIAGMDVAALRNLQAAHTLIGAATVIAAGAEAGIEAQEQTAEDRKKQAARRQAAIEAQDLAWLQIGRALDVRRQRMAELVREHLAGQRDAMLDTLQYELDRSPDVKACWERDLPFRLQRELRSVAGQSNSAVARQLAEDVKWLQETLRKQFNYNLPEPGAGGFNVEPETPLRPDMKLADFATISAAFRVGSIAAVVGSIWLFGPTAGLPMVVSGGAGLLSEQIVRWHANKDREKVRIELVRMVRQAEVDYSQAVASTLRSSYDRIIDGLKEHQARWRAAQLEAAALAVSQVASATRWRSILERTRALITEINQAVHP